MRRLIPILAALLGCCTPALAPAQQSFAEGPVFVTWANCSWPTPKVFLDASLDTSAWRPVFLAHGADHVRQALAMGCRAFQAGTQDPQARLAGEAEAFCAGLRVALRLDLIPSIDAAVDQGASFLAENSGMKPKSAAEILHQSCDRAPP